jgi:hypothetical protein
MVDLLKVGKEVVEWVEGVTSISHLVAVETLICRMLMTYSRISSKAKTPSQAFSMKRMTSLEEDLVVE